MAARFGGSLAIWLGAALVAVSAAAMLWMWRSGGVALPGVAQAEVEECGAVIAGSSAMTARLAPEAAAQFLRGAGYEVETIAGEQPNETRAVGKRGALSCTIVIRRSTTAEAMRDLAQGDALIALAQRPITPREVDALRQAGAGDFAAERDSAEHLIALDAFAVVVNEASPLHAISIDQAREIAVAHPSEQPADAEENPDRPPAPTIYAAVDGVGPDDYPNDIIAHPNPAWIDALGKARVFATESEALAALAQDAGGVGFVSGAFVKHAQGVRALDVSAAGRAHAPTAVNIRNENYPLARRLFAYVRPADMRDNAFAQRFVAFLASPQAFDLIDAAGFAALRPESRLSRFAPELAGCRIGTAEYSALLSATKGATRLDLVVRFKPGTLELDDATRFDMPHYASSLRGRIAAGASVVLVGHADFTGEVAKNRAAALRRALAARGAFEEQGVFGLEVESAGEMCPVGDNETPEGREANRRVEIWVRPAAR